MLNRQRLLTLVVALMLLVILGPAAVAPAADKDLTKSVAGILIEKNNDSLTVKADREDEPVKYLIPADNKALTKTLKGVFNAARVQLTYKTDGEARQLLTIKKQIFATTGTVTGTVVKVYDNFWVEVKPKNMLADAFAPTTENFKNKDFMDRLKGLQKGDSVTITFTTDFERHRILTLKKN